MSFLDDIAARVVAQGAGALGTNLFLSSRAILPTGDGPYTTITETGGMAPIRHQNQDAAATLRPTAQVIVRAATYPSARARAQAVYRALDGIFNTTVNGVFYLRLVARQEPTDMDVDGAGRAQVVFNVEAEKQP